MLKPALLLPQDFCIAAGRPDTAASKQSGEVGAALGCATAAEGGLMLAGPAGEACTEARAAGSEAAPAQVEAVPADGSLAATPTITARVGVGDGSARRSLGLDAYGGNDSPAVASPPSPPAAPSVATPSPARHRASPTRSGGSPARLARAFGQKLGRQLSSRWAGSAWGRSSAEPSLAPLCPVLPRGTWGRIQ
jgi:hypothetical protein